MVVFVFSNAVNHSLVKSDGKEDSTIINEPSCSGTENDISDCPRKIVVRKCTSYSVYVKCKENTATVTTLTTGEVLMLFSASYCSLCRNYVLTFER